GVAAVLGLVLCAVTGHWWLIAVGALAILAAWYYTGGRNPYGYRGLGEVGVFVFFGLVATLGTTYTQAGVVTWPSVVGAVAVGLLACAILMVNNVRDIPTDVVAGKRTLAVRLGDFRARRAYVAMIWLPLLLAVVCAFASPWALATLLLLLPAALLSVPVIAGARGPLLVPALAGTGLYGRADGVLVGVGLAPRPRPPARAELSPRAGLPTRAAAPGEGVRSARGRSPVAGRRVARLRVESGVLRGGVVLDLAREPLPRARAVLGARREVARGRLARPAQGPVGEHERDDRGDEHEEPVPQAGEPEDSQRDREEQQAQDGVDDDRHDSRVRPVGWSHASRAAPSPRRRPRGLRARRPRLERRGGTRRDPEGAVGGPHHPAAVPRADRVDPRQARGPLRLALRGRPTGHAAGARCAAAA